MDEHTISPAGDPFHVAPHDHDDTVEAHYAALERLEVPHACYDGTVFIGEMVDDYMGGEVEIFWPVPCRRCNAAGETR